MTPEEIAFTQGRASRDEEIAELRKLRDEIESLRKLRDTVMHCREWFETQAKVKSKGVPSLWDLMPLRDERDAADEALIQHGQEQPIQDQEPVRNEGARP
jgi:hypothetical protein